MTDNQSIRYWFAFIVSSIVSIVVALAIIALSWYLLCKFVLSRFGVIRALFQINNNDQPPNSQSTSKQPRRHQHIRRE
jgi:1,4-dihydroxy-2-naphthoate octaprenyltransferase